MRFQVLEKSSYSGYVQILQYAASMKCWQLNTSDQSYANLNDGIFVEGDLSHYGQAAAAFINQELPVFKVPWKLKKLLEKADAGQCKTLTPTVLRQAAKLHQASPHEICFLLAKWDYKEPWLAGSSGRFNALPMCHCR